MDEGGKGKGRGGDGIGRRELEIMLARILPFKSVSTDKQKTFSSPGGARNLMSPTIFGMVIEERSSVPFLHILNVLTFDVHFAAIGR